MKNKITENSKLKDILKIKGAEEILTKHEFPCLSCPMASIELEQLKIGEVCSMYGINSEKMLKDLRNNKK